MLRGYRLLGIAALAVALFITLFLGAYFGALNAPNTQHYQFEAADGGKSNPSAKAKNGLSDISGMDGYTERVIAKPQPKDGEERENRDLAAQENSAVFAYWVFWAVVLQTLLAGGALVALVKDLRQNRKSTEMQLRAYCSLKTANGIDVGPDLEPKIEMVVINSGQTPAFRMKIDTECRILESRELPELEPCDITGHGTLPVHPGGTVGPISRLGRKITSEEWQKLIDGDLVIWLVAFGEYYDIFERRQTFRVTAAMRGLPERVVLSPTADGNHFT